jgi:hypothetical protein
VDSEFNGRDASIELRDFFNVDGPVDAPEVGI